MSNTCYFKTFSTPVGRLKLIASDAGIRALLWENDSPLRVPLPTPLIEDDSNPILVKAERQLNEYFAGKRKTFDLPLDPLGTNFQKGVWRLLTQIPFGETRSYGQLAKKLGDANKARPVGGANGKNPISIIVPCHRVIGSSGRLTGFAGGLPVKRFLLELEQRAN